MPVRQLALLLGLFCLCLAPSALPGQTEINFTYSFLPVVLRFHPRIQA